MHVATYDRKEKEERGTRGTLKRKRHKRSIDDDMNFSLQVKKKETLFVRNESKKSREVKYLRTDGGRKKKVDAKKKCQRGAFVFN